MSADTSHRPEGWNGRKPIWVFTASRTAPENLEFILVQRGTLLQDAVDRVRESALTDHKHHQLFVGPRGCGKTHLVALIVSRLTLDAGMVDRLRIAWLSEDETCTTLLELLLAVHAALAKRYPGEYRGDALAGAYEAGADEAREIVSQCILSSLGARTLLVVAENLDAIFAELGDEGQKQLRAFIQENPRLAIVATAQKLVEDLSNRTSPFFGFFQTEHLKPLNVTEATELLQKIARLNENASLIEFLSTSRGRARVRALHHLSGGNHRIYIVLSQFATRDTIDGLLEPFLKMVDELTPYYQERIRWLAPQQRKIVEYLCRCEAPVPVKEIARRLFATPQTISSQLQNLREKGYVEASQRGRESLYEISEPLMRICVEVKENEGAQPLRLLVDFLRVWYDEHELQHRLRTLEPSSVSCAYVESAIRRNYAEGSLRKQLMLEDLQVSLAARVKPSALDGLERELTNQPEAVVLAIENWYEGNKAEARKCLDDAIADESSSSTKASLLLQRANFHSMSGESQNALADYTAVIELSGAPVEQVAMALFNRGVRFFRNGRKQESQSDFEALIRLPNAPSRNLVNSYLALSELHFSDGKWSEGFQALEKGLEWGAKAQPAYHGTAAGLIGVIFSAGLSPEGRREKAGKLLETYGKHRALPVLGQSLVHHIGSVFRAGAPFPSTDNLEGWASAWEQAAGAVADFRLSLRLLRTGIDFVKAGGKDRGVLLNVTSPERAILEQALGLAEPEEEQPT